MKKYVKPMMEGQMFVANEYVAQCWKIKCNVPYGIGFYDNNNNNSCCFGVGNTMAGYEIVKKTG